MPQDELRPARHRQAHLSDTASVTNLEKPKAWFLEAEPSSTLEPSRRLCPVLRCHLAPHFSLLPRLEMMLQGCGDEEESSNLFCPHSPYLSHSKSCSWLDVVANSCDRGKEVLKQGDTHRSEAKPALCVECRPAGRHSESLSH